MQASLFQLELLSTERNMLMNEAIIIRQKPLPWTEFDKDRIVFITHRLRCMDSIEFDLHRVMNRFCYWLNCENKENLFTLMNISVFLFVEINKL